MRSTLSRSSGRGRLAPAIIVGSVLVALGIALVGSSAGYLLFSQVAKNGLSSDLVVNTPGQSAIDSLPQEWRASQTGDLSASGAAPSVGTGADIPTQAGVGRAVEPAATGAASPLPGSPGFRWVDWTSLPRTLGEAPRGTRVAIPAIEVDSPVVEVTIVEDGGKRVWQRPKQSIGHHLGTANPGEFGNVVISGHINSPVRGEGSVFKRLPEIPRRILAGEAVEVFVFTEEKTYVYRIVSSEVLKPEDVRVFDPTGKPTLTVITCVPDLVYSDRLVLTGLLIKVADGGSPWLGQRDEGVVVSPL